MQEAETPKDIGELPLSDRLFVVVFTRTLLFWAAMIGVFVVIRLFSDQPDGTAPWTQSSEPQKSTKMGITTDAFRIERMPNGYVTIWDDAAGVGAEVPPGCAARGIHVFYDADDGFRVEW